MVQVKRSKRRKSGGANVTSVTCQLLDSNNFLQQLLYYNNNNSPPQPIYL